MNPDTKTFLLKIIHRTTGVAVVQTTIMHNTTADVQQAVDDLLKVVDTNGNFLVDVCSLSYKPGDTTLGVDTNNLPADNAEVK